MTTPDQRGVRKTRGRSQPEELILPKVRTPKVMNISPQSVRDAADHIAHYYGTTPLLPLGYIRRAGIRIRVWGKFENAQSLYTFKTRGAAWFVKQVAKEYYSQTGRFRTDKSVEKNKRTKKPVLVTASAGNHAQGLALAARRNGFKAVIFMPESVSPVKRERVEKLGAKIVLVPGVFDDSLAAALKFKAKKPTAIFVSPYQHPDIMAGQGSVGVEILRELAGPNYNFVAQKFGKAGFQGRVVPDALICGLGGGGLVSGLGTVIRDFNQSTGFNIKVIGVQTEAADSMYQSVKAGTLRPSTNPTTPTCAEGIAVRNASASMLLTVQHYASQVVVVSEASIQKGILAVAKHPMLKDKTWKSGEIKGDEKHRKFPVGTTFVSRERKLYRVEGAAAAPYAAVLWGDKNGELDWPAIANGKKSANVVVVFSGGNILPDKWREIIEKNSPNKKK